MSKGKQPAATTQTTTTEFPTELRPYITDILERSKARAEAEEKAGYQAYSGPRIAGFDPSQLAAQQKTEDVVAGGISADPMLRSAQTYYTPALNLTLGQSERFGDVAGQYMSPYQQAVVDVEKREAARGFAPQLQDIRAKSVGAGGFGGSRGALLESEAMRNQGRLLSDIQTRGSQAAFQSGQAAFEAQKARERGAAGGLAAMGAAIPGQAFKEIGALEAMGAGRRSDAQRALDLGYSQFQEEQLFPTKTLQEYQSIVRGFPYTPNTYTTSFSATPPASMAQNILGLGTGIAGLAGAFGGFGAKEGGHMAKLAQGDRPSNAPISEAYKNENVTSGAFPLASMFQNLFSSDDEDKPEYQFKEGEERTVSTMRGPVSYKYKDGDFYRIKKDGTLAKSPASPSLITANLKNVSPEGEAKSPIVATEAKPIVQTEPQDISTLVRDVIPGGAEPDDTKTVIKPSTVAADNLAALAAKAKVDSTDNDEVSTGGSPSATATTTNTKPPVTDTPYQFTLPKNTKLTDLEKLLEASAKEIKDREVLTPEMKAFKAEYADLKSKLGDKQKAKKGDLKKQKYLQLAQFGLNVLSADTTKGDLQIVGEAAKQPLAEVGRIVGEEGDITDKTDAQRLAILGKEAEIAQQAQTGERQKLADTLSLIGKQVDLQKARNEAMNIDSTVSQSTVNSLIATSPVGELANDPVFGPKIQSEINEAYQDIRNLILSGRLPDDNMSVTSKFSEILSGRLSKLGDKTPSPDGQIQQGNKPSASQTLSGNY